MAIGLSTSDVGGKRVEIQVRTAPQQAWAELSEKLSDVVDRALKYGGGDQRFVSLLTITSEYTMAREVAIKTKDIDQIERLNEVIRQWKGLIDDIPN
jgi:ppGpp synthetase/RelA/SpoT-type nucleotidyltranferase